MVDTDKKHGERVMRIRIKWYPAYITSMIWSWRWEHNSDAYTVKCRLFCDSIWSGNSLYACPQYHHHLLLHGCLRSGSDTEHHPHSWRSWKETYKGKKKITLNCIISFLPLSQSGFEFPDSRSGNGSERWAVQAEWLLRLRPQAWLHERCQHSVQSR